MKAGHSSGVAGPAPALGGAQDALRTLQHSLGELPAVLREFDAVAAKTKLLGFNASILAAQAGSEGRSFAVVAEQMKALNQRAYASTQRLHVVVEALMRGADHTARALQTAAGRSPSRSEPRPDLLRMVASGQDAPEVPARPESPVPEVPEGPRPSEVPARPEVQEVPDAPELPEVPRRPGEPEIGFASGRRG